MRILVTAIAFLLFSVHHGHARHYRIASLNVASSHALATAVLPEVYARLGHTVSLPLRPAERARKEAVTGVVDGDALRISSFADANPTLIRVPTPIDSIRIVAFIKPYRAVNFSTAVDLPKYKVGRVRGIKNAELLTQDVPRITTVNTLEHMMLLLHLDRIDVAIFSLREGVRVLKKLGYTEVVPHPIPLVVHPLYHYVHKKHKKLVPKLDAVLQEMQQSGELAKLTRQALNALDEE